MASLDHTSAGVPASSIPSLAHRVVTFVTGIFVRFAEARARAVEFEYYTTLSDRELEARGLTRDQIAAHVFRDLTM